MPDRRRLLKRAARNVPYLREVLHERDQLRAEVGKRDEAIAALEAVISSMWVPPGHFYSPILSLDEVRNDDARIFRHREDLPGVDMRDEAQVALLEEFAATYYPTIPFQKEKSDGLRYFYENGAYSYADAIFLHSMIRHVKPKRIIEVGSGYSSCVTLDTNEMFFEGAIRCTFIEPYTDTLLSLLKPGEADRLDIVPTRLQDVDPALFEELGANDILFIDSTHVSKTGSDVNYLFFDVLPRLAKGVYIHFHDIFYPFEYPAYWVYEGRSWSEAYVLHAFLQHNTAFQVIVHTDYLAKFHGDKLQALMPEAMKNTGGSIWLKRVED